MAIRIIKDNVIHEIYARLNKIRPSVYEPDQAIATSYLGTPVYSNLQINGGQFQDPVTGEIIEFEGIIIDSVVFEVSGEKNIVSTDIQGRDGSVKELIALKDRSINIVGYLVSNQINVAPIELKNTMIKICDAKTSVEVVSSFLNDFGIFNIVIDKHSISEVQGKRSILQFSLQCVSDLPYDLEIEKE